MPPRTHPTPDRPKRPDLGQRIDRGDLAEARKRP